MDRLQFLTKLRDTQIDVVETLKQKGYDKINYGKDKKLYQKEVRLLNSLNAQIKRLKSIFTNTEENRNNDSP